PAAVASGHRPDAGTLVPQQQGDGLELRAHRRRHAAALGRRFDLTGGSSEHRDDVAVVADASLLPRGGTASARLALAWSSQRLLLVECRGPVATAACRTVPRTGRGTSRAEGRCFERRADSRICGDLRDQRSGPRQASHADPEPPAGGLMTTARWKVVVGRPVQFSGTSFILTRAGAHNSRPA